MAGTEVDLLDSCWIARQGNHLERLKKFKRSFGKGGGIMIYSGKAHVLDSINTQLVHNRATETCRERNPCAARPMCRCGWESVASMFVAVKAHIEGIAT